MISIQFENFEYICINRPLNTWILIYIAHARGFYYLFFNCISININESRKREARLFEFGGPERVCFGCFYPTYTH